MEIIKTESKTTTTEKRTYIGKKFNVKEIYENDKLISRYLERIDLGKGKSLVYLKKFTKEDIVTSLPKYEFNKFIENLHINLRDVDIEDINDESIYICDYYSSILFTFKGEIVPLPIYISYIGSLKQRVLDDMYYTKLIELLKEHPFIYDLEEGEIPYYNQDFDGQCGILKAWCIPTQNVASEIWDYSKSNNKNPSVAYRDNFLMKTYREFKNVYGDEIKKLLINYYEQEEHYTDDETGY